MASALSQAKSFASYNNRLFKSNQREANQFNSREASKNRSWQERMANTAHQREVADLQKAGLNPILSGTGGNGASVGSGAQATGQAANVDTGMVNAVIDMATAQLNSATQLQTTAMNNQTQAMINNANLMNDWRKHTTVGANSIVGQLEYGLASFADYLGSLSSKDKHMEYIRKHGFGNGSMWSDFMYKPNHGLPFFRDRLISAVKMGKHSSRPNKFASHLKKKDPTFRKTGLTSRQLHGTGGTNIDQLIYNMDHGIRNRHGAYDGKVYGSRSYRKLTYKSKASVYNRLRRRRKHK